jgi:ribose transport system ATP-binding protein
LLVALNQVNFSVYPGEVVALIGENGAGKSTLMKTLGGLHRQDEGEIRIDGKPAEIRNVSDSLHLGISLIHQELNNLDNLDVGGNIFLGREPLTGGFLRLIDRRKIANQSRAYLKKVGLELATYGLVSYKRELLSAENQRQKLSIKTASTNTLAKNLSGGNQQKVVLAKWLSLQPKLIIFDEPTRGVDVGSKAEIYRLMRGLSDAGVFILMISSDMEEVLGVSDRIAVMREGMLTGIIEADDFSEKNVMKLAVAPVRTALELAS